MRSLMGFVAAVPQFATWTNQYTPHIATLVSSSSDTSMDSCASPICTGIVGLHLGMFDLSPSQTLTSGQVSVLRLSNLSSQDHNKKISCIAENIVGEKESSVVLNILCGFHLCDLQYLLVPTSSFNCMINFFKFPF